MQDLDDLCWQEHGFYFDVIQDTKGEWSAYFNNNRLQDGFETREAAEAWLNDSAIRQEHGIAPKQKHGIQ